MKLRFDVSHELIAQLLQLPPTARIVDIQTDGVRHDRGTSTIYAEDTALPESTDYVEASPSTTAHYSEWHWNVQ